MDLTLPREWGALCVVVFLLGLRHGFDADHLATIDGLTRFNAAARPQLARYCGALFSLGHGAIVLVIALAVSTVAGHWQVPAWTQALGAWVSIAFLALLGFINLRTVLGAPPQVVVAPVGVKGRLLGRLGQAASAGAVALVGALFAISFDTLSQAVLFSLASMRFGGWHSATLLALAFLCGMLVTDGLNGLWISRLLRKADRMARVASRTMGLVVGSLSLLVAIFGLARMAQPQLAQWSDGRELLLGSLLVALVAASFLLASRLARSSVESEAVAGGRN